MGSFQATQSLIQSYNTQNTQNGLKILSDRSDPSLKYLLKTYNTTSIDQHNQRLQHFRKYKAKMSQNIEVTKLIHIREEKEENFCTHTYKTHLIFQYSAISLKTEIQVRKSKMVRICDGRELKTQYFSYEDLCNILYSCLSALWLVQESKAEALDPQRKQFNTVFLTSQNILVFEDGTIKIMDPYLIGYEKRYIFGSNIAYSPQKLQDFYMIDDEKCSIFELGMLLLELSLLEPNKSVYSGSEFNQQILNKKLYKARKVYSSDLEQTLGVNLFDILEKMTTRNRENRPNLEQTIRYAEEMYEKEDEGPTSRINSSKKKYTHSSGKKHELKLTNHSSSGKKMSPNLEKFYCFKDSVIHYHNLETGGLSDSSPKVSNFTIEQAPIQKEQSSMLESLKVQNPAKVNFFSESLLNGDVFSTLRLNDSYNYNWPSKKSSQQQIFTDPLLLKTINRQLQEIEHRKLKRSQTKDLKSSQTLQRKDRYHMQLGQHSCISNKVYLAD